MKIILRYSIQILVFIMLVYLLISQLPIDELKEAFNSFKLSYLLPSVLFVFLRILVLSFKWKVACWHKNAPTTSWFAQREFHILFIEMVFPIPDAEDMLRLSFMRMRNISWSEGLQTVLAMRVTGVFVLLLTLAVFLAREGASKVTAFSEPVLLTVVTCAFVVIFFHRSVLLLLNRVLQRIPRLGSLLIKHISAALSMRISNGQYLILAFLSLLVYVAEALGYWSILLGMQAQVSFLELYLLMPFLALSFIIPLSLQGFGLPEAALAFLLPFSGTDPSTAAAAGAIHLAVYSSAIVTGGLLYLLWKEDDLSQIWNRITKKTEPFSDESATQ